MKVILIVLKCQNPLDRIKNWVSKLCAYHMSDSTLGNRNKSQKLSKTGTLPSKN